MSNNYNIKPVEDKTLDELLEQIRVGGYVHELGGGGSSLTDIVNSMSATAMVEIYRRYGGISTKEYALAEKARDEYNNSDIKKYHDRLDAQAEFEHQENLRRGGWL